MAKMTGHKTALTFATSGFNAAMVEIGGATHSREKLKSTDLQTNNYHDYEPGDLVDGGESTVQFFYDPNEQPPIQGAKETIVKTYQVPAGLTNGATVTRTGFIVTWEEPTAVTDELMMSTVVIAWSGTPTYADAS